MPQITLGEPVLVSQAPVEVKKWGPWQFPHLERLADGRIHLEFHVEADSVTAYGLPTRHALSADDGGTWQAVAGRDARGGLLLPNGDRLLPVQLQSRARDEVVLPEPVLVQEDAPNRITHIYRAADLPADLSGWRFLRLRRGEAAWVEETASVRVPGEIRIVREGMYASGPRFTMAARSWRPMAPFGKRSIRSGSSMARYSRRTIFSICSRSIRDIPGMY